MPNVVSESRPDFYLSTVKDGVPNRPVLVSDFKESNFDEAVWESIG